MPRLLTLVGAITFVSLYSTGVLAQKTTPILSDVDGIVQVVENIDDAREWYGNVFGLTPEVDSPHYISFRFDNIEVGFVSGDARPTGDDAVSTSWNVDDIEVTVQRLIDRGATVYEDIYIVGRGIQVAKVLDPFGFMHRLLEMPRQSD